MIIRRFVFSFILVLVVAVGTLSAAQPSKDLIVETINGIRYCDEFASLQACHDDLPTTGGKMVIPAGTYTLTAELLISKSNVHIECAGVGNTIIERNGMPSTDSVIQIDGSHVAVTGCTFDGRSESTTKATVNLNGISTRFEHNQVLGNGHIAVGISKDDASVIDNEITGQASATQGSSGIWCAADSIDRVLIKANRISDQMLAALQCVGNDIAVIDNVIWNNHCQTSPTGGGQLDFSSGGSGGAVVSGNIIGPGCGSLTSGIEVHRHATIIGNTIRGQKHHGT